MLNIEPIKLLSGSHADTATTGSGCFMNVIAYLNGDPQITDQSTCVCPTIRPIAIWLNDYMNDDERSQLIPFIHRAMGTAPTNVEILVKRARRAVVLANEMAKYASYAASYAAESAKYAKYAAKYAESAEYAASYAAKSAKYAAKYAESAASYAAKSAKYAAKYAESAAMRKEIIASGLRYLEDVCPVADLPTAVLIERAEKLVALATS